MERLMMKPNEKLLKNGLIVLQWTALIFCFITLFYQNAFSSSNLNQEAEKEATALGITIPKSISTLNRQGDGKNITSEQKTTENSKAADPVYTDIEKHNASMSPVPILEKKKMENEPIKLKNSTKIPAESVETAEKLTPTHIEPSSAPQRETSEEKKMPATPVAEKNSAPSGAAPVTVPNDVPRTAPAQIPAEAVPVERKEFSKPAVNETTSPSAIHPLEEQQIKPAEKEQQLSSSRIEPSPTPQHKTDEERNTPTTHAAKKSVVPSDTKTEPSVTVPADAARTAPVQVPTEAVPAERKEHSVPAAVTPAVPVPGVSTPPVQPDITEPEKNIPKKAVTTAEFIGTWKGQFTNAYGKTAATLTVKERGKRPYCVFTFYPLRENPGAGSGQFEMNISLNEETGDCELRGVRWIKNPKRRALMHLRGKISGNEFSGKIFADIPTPNDWIFRLDKKVQ